MKNTIGRHIFQRKLLAPGAMTNVENELFHKHVKGVVTCWGPDLALVMVLHAVENFPAQPMGLR